jgi:hypothetical protein
MAAIVFHRGVATMVLYVHEFIEPQCIMLQHDSTFVALQRVGKRRGADVGEFHGLGLWFVGDGDVLFAMRRIVLLRKDQAMRMGAK